MELGGSSLTKSDLPLLEINSASGGTAILSPLGATLRSLKVPSRFSGQIDVVLGYATESEYRSNPWYLGCTVGRHAGRVARGTFRCADQSYQLSLNDGDNHLHGGHSGFHLKNWEVLEHTAETATFAYGSRDGEEGYPGQLDVRVTYSWSERNALTIEYWAICDETTLINLTNHSYFNLSGHDHGFIGDHRLQILAPQFAEFGEGSLPTGRLLSVEGSLFDLREPVRLGDLLAIQHPQLALAGGIDHSWVLAPRENPLENPVAILASESSGICMATYTDQPTVHVYTGNFLPTRWAGPNGASYGRRQGICLETQHLPDSPNQNAFETAILAPGEIYQRQTTFDFDSGDPACV